MYWKYFKYILEHKKNVFIECMKIAMQHQGKIRRRLIIHAFAHDLSKLLPCEFIPYAIWFYGEYGIKVTQQYSKEMIEDMKLKNSSLYLKHKEYEEQFNKAWEHHYKHNKHHEDYWQGKDMPYIYLMQLIEVD
jgi:hypothetical protein